DVRGLDVAVEDPVLVGVVERPRQLLEHPHRLTQLHGLAEPVRQGSSLDELEHQVGEVVLVAEVEDLQDVRMLETGDRPRLLLEALAVERVVGEEVGEDLDRHVAVESGVVGAVDGRHAAAADALEQTVGPDRGSLLHLHVRRPSRMSTLTAGGALTSASVVASTAAMPRRRPGASSALASTAANLPSRAR